MQNFETHYKAAAFALLKSRSETRPPAAYVVVSVGADWTSNENIIGYPDGLNSKSYVSRPALNLIRSATEPQNRDIPHFLILDEMNLSHVERYFADVLSVIESDEPMHLYSGDPRTADGRSLPHDLKFPPNLFVIGTVNVDETTYAFSPKVLDRANVIEFRMTRDDVDAFLQNPTTPHLEKLEAPRRTIR